MRGTHACGSLRLAVAVGLFLRKLEQSLVRPRLVVLVQNILADEVPVAGEAVVLAHAREVLIHWQLHLEPFTTNNNSKHKR